MESDLPLMELTEVDDSLIQPFPDPNQTPSKSSFNYFTCSPLALPPSRIKSLKDSVHTEKPSSSSETSNNKENINSNNIEMPKLGMGPIQMKRKKKGAECNLRKSLAWDRAFFTDEGILDPRELNLITGINAYTCGRGLPSISEEGNSSFSSSRRCRNEPNDMEPSKEALLKELHDKSRTPKGKRVGIHDSLPHHKVTPKVLSSDHSNRAVSKFGGCSEPSPASSLKRRNSNILRTTKKESKLPKLPMSNSKTGSCSSAMTKGSLAASQLRHNLIPKPPMNVQKNVGLKDVHASQSKAKTEPTQKATQTQTNTSSKATSSSNLHVGKANSGLEMVSDRLQSCEIQDESTPLAIKSLSQHTPTTSNNSLPSGLRLPSPSLRFFDQTTSESVSLHQKRHQQSNGQNSELRPPGTPRTPSGSTQLSPSSSYIGNSAKRVTDCNIYPDIVRKIMLRADIVSHEIIEQEKRISKREGKMGMEKIALKGDEEIGASIHNEEEKVENYTATLVSTSGESIEHQEHNILTMIDGSNSMKFMQDLAQTSNGQADSENFVESERDRIGKREDYRKSLVMEDDGRCKIIESLKDEVNLPITLMKSKAQDQSATCSVNCIKPAEEEGPHANVTEIHDDKPNEPQDSVGIMPLMETKDCFTVSQQPTTNTSTSLCSESILVVEGSTKQVELQLLQQGKNKDATVLMERSNERNRQEDNSLVMHPPNAFDDIEARVEDHAQTSKVSYMEEVEAEAFQQGKSKDATVSMKRSNNIKRQDKSLVIPFSDEWLAAIEAAGEEILTMKCGAVQHSPPDKPLPQRNPWSPVKNKANQIGPYDCTKYTNSMHSNPHLLDQ